MRDDRLIKLSRPIEITMPEGWHARVFRVAPCLLQATRELAEGQRAELSQAWVNLRLYGNGKSRRVTVDLVDHDPGTCGGDCWSERVLLNVLEALLVRRRKGAKPRPEPERPMSIWPFQQAIYP